MTSSLAYRISNLIKTEGYITLDYFLSLVIAHYYSKNHGIGKDFITSPEISQMFGEMIGVWLGNFWLNSLKKKFTLIELGPGKGLLMSDILRTIKKIPNMYKHIEEVALIEISPDLKKSQKSNLTKYRDIKINWYSDLSLVKNNPCLVVANEYFDALPIKQLYIKKNKIYEVVVSTKNDKFCFHLMHIKTLYNSNDNDKFLEISPYTVKNIELISHMINNFGGASIIIDYGYTIPINKSSLQAIKNHKKLTSIFEYLGEADITSLVNFQKIQNTYNDFNIKNSISSQTDFLIKCGIQQRAESLIKNGAKVNSIKAQLNRLLSPDEMGKLFKVLTAQKIL